MPGPSSAVSRQALAASLFTVVAAVCLLLTATGTVQHAHAFVYGHPTRPLRLDSDTDSAFLQSLAGITILDSSLYIDSSFMCTDPTLNADLTASLSTLREIRGFLRVDTACTDLAFLSSLAVIHGQVLWEREYAFFVTGSGAGFTLNLNSLTQVLEGSILLDGTDVTSLAVLEDLVPSGTIDQSSTDMAGIKTVTFMNSNRTVVYTPETTAVCDGSCTGGCWDTDSSDCQQDTSCPVEGCEVGTTTPCPASCRGGCTDLGGSVIICHACAEGMLKDSDGACVATCSAAVYASGYAVQAHSAASACDPYASGNALAYNLVNAPFYCADACDRNMALDTDASACVIRCPDGGVAGEDGSCTMQSDFSVCENVYDISHSCQLDVFKNETCDMILGSVVIVPYGATNGDVSLSLGPKTALDESLPGLRRIGGALYVHRMFHGDLSGLSNVRHIGGDGISAILDQEGIFLPSSGSMHSLYSLDINLNYGLRLLSLRSLRSLGSGTTARIVNNYFLSHHNFVNWTALGVSEQIFFDRFTNVQDFFPSINIVTDTQHPVLLENSECDPLCGGNCWGETQYDCQRPREGLTLFNGTIVPQCPDGFYSNDSICLPCASTCATCFGEQSSQCLSCEAPRNLLGSVCVRDCGSGYYEENQECIECNELCLECVSATSCSVCNPISAFQLGLTMCVSECPRGFVGVLGDNNNTCLACPDDCDTCSEDLVCATCGDEFFLDEMSGNCVPRTQCPLPDFYILDLGTDTTDRACGNVTVCGMDEFISVVATNVSDAECSPCTPCDPMTHVRADGTCFGTLDSVCVLIDYCGQDPCENGGVCENVLFGFNCTCVGNFCGDRCDRVLINGRCESAAESPFSSTSIVGASVGAGFLLLFVVVGAIWFTRREHKRYQRHHVASKELKARFKLDQWELDRSLLTFVKELGKGNFGLVSLYVYEGENGGEVAVKELKENASKMAEDEFSMEANIMKKMGRHNNVLSLIGVCTLVDPILIVAEYAEEGDLLSYVRGKAATTKYSATLGVREFYDYAAQIAAGMQFLCDNRIVHRDLAARNVLVARVPGGSRVARRMKVSDFGLSKILGPDEETYAQPPDIDAPIPYKWTPPEAIEHGIFSFKSDVWSYGVTIWEMTSFGARPYPVVFSIEDLLHLLRSGDRLRKPGDCEEDMYDVLKMCWDLEPENRPTFDSMIGIFANKLGKTADDFLDLKAGQKPVNNAYFDEVKDTAYDNEDTLIAQRMARKRSSNNPISVSEYDDRQADQAYDLGDAADGDRSYLVPSMQRKSQGTADYDLASESAPSYDLATPADGEQMYDQGDGEDGDLYDNEFAPLQGGKVLDESARSSTVYSNKRRSSLKHTYDVLSTIKDEETDASYSLLDEVNAPATSQEEESYGFVESIDRQPPPLLEDESYGLVGDYEDNRNAADDADGDLYEQAEDMN